MARDQILIAILEDVLAAELMYGELSRWEFWLRTLGYRRAGYSREIEKAAQRYFDASPRRDVD